MIAFYIAGVVVFAVQGAFIVARTQDIRDAHDAVLWGIIVLIAAAIWPLSVAISIIGWAILRLAANA